MVYVPTCTLLFYILIQFHRASHFSLQIASSQTVCHEHLVFRTFRQSLPFHSRYLAAHEQRAHALCIESVLSIGVATKRHYLWHSWIVSLNLKHTKASFSPSLTDLLCLWVAQVPRSRDMETFVLTTTMMTTTRPMITLPLAHARGLKSYKM